MGENTAIVQRANVVLQVNADDVDRYIAKGYNVVDESGNIIVRSIPSDVSGLKSLIAELQKEIDALKSDVDYYKTLADDLTEEVETLKAKKTTRTKKAE